MKVNNNAPDKVRPRPGVASRIKAAFGRLGTFTGRVARGDGGFTLPELLIVLVIVGILAVLAIPRFFSVTARAKMAEAKLMLRQVYTLQEAYYYEYDRYASDLTALGFEQTRLITEDGTARYLIGIEEADGVGFIAAATAVVDFDKDGTFNVWEVDAEGVIRQRVAD